MKNGFTLIELIIYIGIVVAILLAAFSFGWQIIYGNVKSQAIREVQQNVRFSMEKIANTVAEAAEIYKPGQGQSHPSLTLKMPDGSYVTFEVIGEKLTITRQKGPFSSRYELTNNRVNVTNLQFTNLSYPETPGTVQVEMTINHVNPAERSEYAVSLGIKSTASLVYGGVAPHVVQLHYRWRNDDGGE